MTDTTFAPYVTPIEATWLTEINDHVHNDTPVSGTTVHESDVVGFIQSGTGAVATTVQEFLRRTITLVDGDDLDAAITSLGSNGGVIKLGIGTFVSTYTTASPLTVDNITIIGSGQPNYASDYSNLSGGTIIQGPFQVTAHNFHAYNLGFDSGSDVCTALYSGTAQESFGIFNPSQLVGRAQWTGIILENISCLVKAANSAVHACLVENVIGASIKNVRTVYGTNGFVLKGAKSKVDGLWCIGHETNAVIVKSDSYAISTNNILTNITIGHSTGEDTNGIRVQAASATTSGLIFSNIYSTCKFGISLETTGSYYITDVEITNINCEGTKYYGIDITGNSQRVNVSNVVVNNTTDATYGYGVAIASTVEGVSLTNIQTTNTASYGIKNSGTYILVSNSKCLNATGYGFYGIGASVMALSNTLGTVGSDTQGNIVGGPPMSFTPTFSALVETPGTGTITKTASWTQVGKICYVEIHITITGNATTASPSGYVSGIPLSGNECTVNAAFLSATPSIATTGFYNGIGSAYLPTWTATNASVIITFAYTRT